MDGSPVMKVETYIEEMREMTQAMLREVAEAVNIPHDAVLPVDSCRTLRRFNGGAIPYAFEVVLGARLIMGDQFCTDDPGVDDVLQEIHDTADTVADIVHIMGVAYGSRAANGGAAQSIISDDGAD